jgi:EAL domain-containing protein (putative c-di-GMP-specific phosphodiesterase class I)
MCASQRLHRAVARVRSHNGRAPRGGIDLAASLGQAEIVLQPIVSVHTGVVLAVEALARFPGQPSSEDVFASAYAAGNGPALEAECLRAALSQRAELPDAMLLTVNISPNALPYLAAADVWPADLHGVVVEITEQDMDRRLDVADLLGALRARGAAIAIDDVSTGYAGLLRLAQMRPDYVKVDRQVVSGVGDSIAQAAVLEALVTLSHRLGAAVIGEGVETFADLDALAEFDVDYAQGHALGRPSAEVVPIAREVVAACRSSRKRVLRGSSAIGHAAARTRDVYAVTAALAVAGQRHDIDAAISATATDLGVDIIGVSILTNGMNLREIASTGEALDTNVYALSDYPATAAVMNGAGTIEIQVGDNEGDAAERSLLHALGHESLLLVPVYDIDRTIGVLEFAHRTPRRWSAQDIAHAQGLAEHLSPVLKRLGVGTFTPARSAS